MTNIIDFSINAKSQEEYVGENEGMLLALNTLEVKLHDLDIRMDTIIRDRNLRDGKNGFIKYNTERLEHIAVPIQTMFTRCSLMLCVYEAQLKEACETFHLQSLPEETKLWVSSLRSVISTMRETYVQKIGGALLADFRKKLPSFDVPDYTPANLDRLLVKYFGAGYFEKDEQPGWTYQKLIEILDDISELTGLESQINTIKIKLDSLATEEL